jgi:hypothetical protein
MIYLNYPLATDTGMDRTNTFINIVTTSPTEGEFKQTTELFHRILSGDKAQTSTKLTGSRGLFGHRKAGMYSST